MRESIIQQMDNHNRRLEEQFNAIRTNVLFYGSDIKTISITSLNENEGKSTISLELAKSLARSGKKTILLNADVRKHNQKFRLKSKTGIFGGLTEYLSDQKTIEEILYSTNVEELYLIPSGRISSNPTILFEKNKFVQLITYLRDHFDYVIIDTPPLGIIIDALIISHRTDASILVLESGRNKKRNIKKMIEKLSATNLFMGVIFNKLDIKDKEYATYYGEYIK